MSRRTPDTHHLDTALDIMCPKGHRVGVVRKFIDQHPRAGKYVTDGGVNLQPSTDEIERAPRLRGTCEKCGADIIILWDRAKERLDTNETNGRHTDQLLA